MGVGGNVTSQDLIVLVDKMAENAENNPYIVRVLESFQNQNFSNLAAKLQEEGDVVIPICPRNIDLHYER